MKQKFSNAPNDAFYGDKYINYVVEYKGDIVEEALLSEDKFITVLNEKYAVVTIRFEDPIKDRYNLQNNPFPSVVYVGKYYPYITLGDIKILDSKEEFINYDSISPIITSNIVDVQNMGALKLTGKGTVVGIIGTGIDYLNEEFMDKNGETRILNIWDQTVTIKDNNSNVPFGREYNRDQINNAIKSNREGKDPYEIVPCLDELGYGTSLAGIIGASGFNKEILSAVPECEFVIVKLARDIPIEKLVAIRAVEYSMAVIMFSIEYLYEHAKENNEYMSMCLPIGTTFGNHRSNGMLENYIDQICNNIRISVVTGSGDEGNSGNHASGKFQKEGEIRDIGLFVSENQYFLRSEIWIHKPNILGIEIISPSGNSSGKLTVILQKKQVYQYIFEETIIMITFSSPEEKSGDELITVDFFYIREGIWRYRIYGEYILGGEFDIWISPEKLLFPGTRFISADNYGTIMTPSTSRYVITTSYYNQNSRNIELSSGVSFVDEPVSKIDITMGGVEIKSIAPNGKFSIINGTGGTAAVLTGVAAIIFQRSSIQRLEPYMYTNIMKTYIKRGTIQRISDIYPNPEWGYGILDLYEVFGNLE